MGEYYNISGHPWTYESKSLRMNQVKFVEDSIAKI